MFGLRFMKFEPNNYVIVYKNGKIAKQGQGLNFWYYSPTGSIVKIPTDVMDEPFMFEENTFDYQPVTIQGNISYKIEDPLKTSTYVNFTLTPKGRAYLDSPLESLSQKIKNAVVVSANKTISLLPLKQAITTREHIKDNILLNLKANEELNQIGVTIVNLSILGIKPNTETARALEAQTREQILKDADDAIYVRRNSSIEQERIVKENEYNTEIAIEEKKREIEERKLKARQGLQKQQNLLKEEQIKADIQLEERKKEWVSLSSENIKIQADAKAYELSAAMKALEDTKQETLQALASVGMDSNRLIAVAFQELAKKAGSIGQLNVSPDLLRELMQ
ncbi:SPFH domain-containing protein [Clostridiales bacterium COT073_COT-073]|nr:SPFH domain-containing protein [Clostridiales bacterium COT073_COT-073]